MFSESFVGSPVRLTSSFALKCFRPYQGNGEMKTNLVFSMVVELLFPLCGVSVSVLCSQKTSFPKKILPSNAEDCQLGADAVAEFCIALYLKKTSVMSDFI